MKSIDKGIFVQGEFLPSEGENVLLDGGKGPNFAEYFDQSNTENSFVPFWLTEIDESSSRGFFQFGKSNHRLGTISIPNAYLTLSCEN